MQKKLIEKFSKKECCKRFKNFKTSCLQHFLRWFLLIKNFFISHRLFPTEQPAPKLLTDHIKQGRKNFEEKSFTEELRTRLSYTYVPSVKSFGYIVASVFLVWGIGEIFEKLSGIESPFPNITAVHAGIGVVIFALVIFVAESLRDNEAKDKARVLLKVSYLFPLVVAEIIVFFILLWGRDDGFGEAFIVSVIGIFTIVSLARIIDVLLSKHKFDKQRINLLQERLRQSIETALDELLGNKVLSSELGDSNIKLCTPSSLDFKYYVEYHNLMDYSKDYYFEAKKNGIIADIKFSELNEVSTLMGKLKANYSATHEEDNPEPHSPDFIFCNSIQVSSNAYLMNRFHDVINEKNRKLICIHNALVDDNQELLKEIERHIDKAFIIKHQDSLMQEISDEISGIKDQFIHAIRNKQHNQIDRLSNLYIRLTDEFLEYIEKYDEIPHANIHVTKQDLINKMERSIWLPIFSIDVFYQTMESHDTWIIRRIFDLARIMSSRAIEKDNYNLFKEFIRFPVKLYESSSEEKDEQLKKLLIKFSCQYLEDVYNVIVSQLRQGTINVNAEQEKHIEEYAGHILFIFNELLKQAFDYKDLDSFKKFQQMVEDRFGDSKSHLLRYCSNEREGEIKSRRNLMYFGLASGILYQRLDERANNKKKPSLNIKNAYRSKEFYDSICSVFSSDIDEFAASFLTIWNNNDIDFWGWDTWAKKAYSLHFLDDLKKFYIVHLLFLLKDKDKNSIENIKLPTNLKTQVASLIKILNQIKNNLDRYRLVLGKIDSKKIDLLEQKFSSIGSTHSQ